MTYFPNTNRGFGFARVATAARAALAVIYFGLIAVCAGMAAAHVVFG